MSEVTSALTFRDLILEVAEMLGVCFYGDDGAGAADIPVDEHDDDRCRRIVNKAINRFMADAPPTGWRWVSTVADVVLWPSVALDAAKTVTGVYEPSTDTTLITASSDVFYETMEGRNLVVTSEGTFEIVQYVSATQIRVNGDESFTTARTYSIAATGDYTLPRGFVGPHTGDPTFSANTNTAIPFSWVNESVIRNLRQDTTTSTGDPQFGAVRVRAGVNGAARRRYELAVYPTPDVVRTLQFPYDVHFDLLTSLVDTSPAPIGHDETIRQACRMIGESDVDDTEGKESSLYQTMLLNSQRIDSRTGPRRLGYFGNPTRGPRSIQNVRDLLRRQNVTFN